MNALLGVLASQPYHYLAVLVPAVCWIATRSFAQKHHITILYTSALAVSYWEEVLFRGAVYGVSIALSGNLLIAIVSSSLLFGLFHLRNLWWSPPRRVLASCLYAGLFFGPLTGLIRYWSGDIYLGIALHAVNNLLALTSSGSLVLTNEFLHSRQKHMNWFEWVFSGFWLLPKRNVN